jgi:PAS domain S-box-containing protein
MVQSRKKKTASQKEATSETQAVSSGDKYADLRSALTHQADDSFLQVMHEVQDYAVILLDVRGTILSWNKGAEKIKGYSADDVIGKNCRMFYTREDRELDLSSTLLQVAMKEGRTSYEGWAVRKDGTRFGAASRLPRCITLTIPSAVCSK